MTISFFSENNRVLNDRFWLFPGVLEGLGSSGRLVGTISTYPGTYKCPWSRVMAKNLREQMNKLFTSSYIPTLERKNKIESDNYI